MRRTKEARKTPGSPRGRRYPRGPHEAGALAAVGDRRAVGVARIGYLHEGLKELEAEALADLGGAENVSALRREVLAIGLAAEGIALALLAEIEDKARRSREAGHVPHPSRYEAVSCVATFLDLAARRFREVGLDRRARDVGTLAGYLASREKTGRGDAKGDRDVSAPEGRDDRPAAADVGGEGA